MESPLGPAVLGFVGDALAWLSFGPAGPGPRDWPFGPVREVAACECDWLGRLAAGRASPSPIPRLALRGTPFQRRVWRALQDIPPGQTRSYRELAEAVGHPKAVRAVGSAVGANRIALVVPCHRVVRADGKLGGYRWGVDLKQRILEVEASCRRVLSAVESINDQKGT